MDDTLYYNEALYDDEPEFEYGFDGEIYLKFSSKNSLIGCTIIASDDDPERFLFIAPHTKDVIGEIFIIGEDD